MATFNGTTDSASVAFPSAISGAQNHTLFCMIKTSSPPNDTTIDQMLAGLHVNGQNFRDLSLSILNADAKVRAQMNLHSSNEQEAFSVAALSALTTYRLCLRWNEAAKTITLNVDEEIKTTGSEPSSPTVNPTHLAFGAEIFTSATEFFKGDGQHVAYWKGVELTDLEVASMMDGSTKPDSVSTAPDYYYPLVDDASSGIGGTAMTVSGAPTFDGVDLWPSAAGPTITGPDSTTEGSATVAAGTGLDTITTQSLISGSYSIAQTIDSATATTLNYVAESGVNLCTPSTPVSGVPLEATISAASVTPWVVQQKADDGTNPPATRNITLNGEATHEVVQAMISTSNTTDGESVLASSIIAVEDDMQYYAPKAVNGMNITWAADGTFTTDADQTETIEVGYFSPATGNWSCIALTVRDTSIVAVGMVAAMVSDMVSNMVEDM